MADTWNGVGLGDLNNYMRNFPSQRIVPEVYTWSTLYDGLKAGLTKNPHIGDNIEFLIETATPFTGQAHGENVDIPYPQDMAFAKAEVPLFEIIVNAGVTKQALDRATGMPGSWGRVVDRVLQARMRDFGWLMEIAALGSGDGKLARVVSIANDGSTSTVTVDNSYKDFGWDSTFLIKKGMRIEIWAVDGTTQRSLNSDTIPVEVTARTYTDRANAIHTNASGTFAYASAAANGVVNGDIVYLGYTHSSAMNKAEYVSPLAGGTQYITLPVGLTGLVSKGVDTDLYIDGSTNYKLTTFQNLTRNTYPTLNSGVYFADDWASGTAGTPDTWDLSDVTSTINTHYKDTGLETDLLICSTELAMCMHRLNRSESGMNVVISNTTGQNQPAVGSEYAKNFIGPTGKLIPILITHTAPRNCLWGISKESLMWYLKGDFQDYGPILGDDTWNKSYNDRKTNFEAPFGGYTTIAAERSDCNWVMFDLKDNL